MEEKQPNKISATRHLNEFSQEFYLKISIDNKPLDEILHEYDPEGNWLGFVPTLSSWLENKDERKVTWERILPKENETVISPILMCPDDLDFWCTIVVVESTCVGNRVIWKRIGSDDTDDRGFHPEHIGQKVNWLDKIGPFMFDKKDFLDCIEEFIKEMNKVN